MLVLALNALTPLAAQAMLSSTKRIDTIEICTSTGMVRLPVEEQGGAGKPVAAQMQSCSFCLLHDVHAWLPPLSIALSIASSHAGIPPAFKPAATMSAVWLAARSRRPPSRTDRCAPSRLGRLLDRLGSLVSAAALIYQGG